MNLHFVYLHFQKIICGLFIPQLLDVSEFLHEVEIFAHQKSHVLFDLGADAGPHQEL